MGKMEYLDKKPFSYIHLDYVLGCLDLVFLAKKKGKFVIFVKLE